MELKAFYAAVGGDDRQVLNRLPSEDMLRRFLHKFSKDPSHAELLSALAAQDFAAAFRAAHTLKGTAANLGLDDLSAAASELTEALRGAQLPPPDSLVAAVNIAHQTALRQIDRLDA